jgi:hypothetical protein
MAEGQATQGEATEQEPEAKTQEAEAKPQEAEAAMLRAPPCQKQEVEVQGQTAHERAIVTTVAKKGIGQESARI